MSKLQYIASEIMECGKGWLEPVQMFVDFVNWHNSCNPIQIEILQIKEKFGDLVIYTHGDCPGLEEIKKKAIKQAHNTCEVCGSTKYVGRKCGGYIQTLCSKCVQDWSNRTKIPAKWFLIGSDKIEDVIPKI